jgi:hypothetical protein
MPEPFDGFLFIHGLFLDHLSYWCRKAKSRYLHPFPIDWGRGARPIELGVDTLDQVVPEDLPGRS